MGTACTQISTVENTYWVHDLSPFLIQLGEGFGLRWYGLAYVMGFLTAIWLLRLYYKRGRSPLDADGRAALMITLVVGVLVGGRLGFMLFYRFGELMENPFKLFKVWEGGMASHGGIIGIVVALILFARSDRRRFEKQQADPENEKPRAPMTFWQLGDIVCTLGPPGVFLGRLANFINGYLWGRVSDASWAVIFPKAQVPPHFDPNGVVVFVEGFGLANPRHPSQLYAAALEGLLLCAYLQWRFWRSESCRKYPGQLGGECLIAYAIVRLLSEVYREPDASLILGLSRGMFYSLFMIIAGAGIIYHARRRPQNTNLLEN